MSIPRMQYVPLYVPQCPPKSATLALYSSATKTKFTSILQRRLHSHKLNLYSYKALHILTITYMEQKSLASESWRMPRASPLAPTTTGCTTVHLLGTEPYTVPQVWWRLCQTSTDLHQASHRSYQRLWHWTEWFPPAPPNEQTILLSYPLGSQWAWEAWKSWPCSSALWLCSAAMACKVFLCICLALLYKNTPTNTRTVPVALRTVMWLLNTMTLSHTDRACFTVLATLRRRGES